MKASDISDLRMLDAVKNGTLMPLGASRWTIESLFLEVPPKVVLAKLHALLRRKLITGCACGCRGDFNITEAGTALAEALRTGQAMRQLLP